MDWEQHTEQYRKNQEWTTIVNYLYTPAAKNSACTCDEWMRKNLSENIITLLTESQTLLISKDTILKWKMENGHQPIHW